METFGPSLQAPRLLDDTEDAMAVVNVSVITVKPGQTEAALQGVRDGKSIVERHGGRNYRLMAPVAGPDPIVATFVLTWETPDMATWGKVNDAVWSDAELLALNARSFSAEGHTSSVVQAVYVDVPLT